MIDDKKLERMANRGAKDLHCWADSNPFMPMRESEMERWLVAFARRVERMAYREAAKVVGCGCDHGIRSEACRLSIIEDIFALSRRTRKERKR